MNDPENQILSRFGSDPEDIAKGLREFSKSAEMLSNDRPRLVDEHPIESAYLAFVGEAALYGYEIELRTCKPAEELMTIPSLLGRDTIDRKKGETGKCGRGTIRAGRDGI